MSAEAGRLRTIAIVGASLAGLRAAEELRRRGYDGRLLLVGEEIHEPYDRPPLSKEILRGSWTREQLRLRREPIEALDVELLLGRRAVALSTTDRTVALDDGGVVHYEGLVVATGARVRRLADSPPLPGIHSLRTVDDALAIRAAFDQGPRVCVVGAGFIGAEVAASARRLGLEVTLVEALAAPLVRVLGASMADLCARLHRDHGVDLRCGSSVAAFEGADRVEQVRLTDGTSVAADLVVVGIGVVPETRWLESSSLELADGVVCDATLATRAPGVVAAGDVARWHNRLFDESMRVEHWTNAAEQGAAAAATLLDGAEAAKPYAPVPYFWSDQYDVKMQVAGRPQADDEVRIVAGAAADNRFVALYGRAGRLTGVLGFRRPRHVMEYMDLIERRASWDEALAHARAVA